jgi:hypothetical protein
VNQRRERSEKPRLFLAGDLSIQGFNLTMQRKNNAKEKQGQAAI